MTKRIFSFFLAMVLLLGSLGVQVSASSATKKLSKPNVSISNTASSGKSKLTWKAISGAQKYYIYRATKKDGEYKKISSTTKTSYTDSSAKVGKTYYYKVKAIHKKSSANSAYSSVDKGVRDLARPDVTAKLSSKGKPKLSWDKISGAEKYYIYRATSKDGAFKKIKTTTATSYTDTSVKSGKTYYYKVKAIHDNTSANSAYSSVDKLKTAKSSSTGVGSDSTVSNSASVWIPTRGGTKYHSKSTCSGMIDPIKTNKSNAIKQGFDPCKRCY